MAVTAFAPAKVNLYLHVTGRRPDGYHLLDSLVAFADIGDRITAEPAASLSLEVGGPEAAGLANLGHDNLVLRAARLLGDHAGMAPGAALYLDKHLPVAAGIGGGSSDAAAALRALRRCGGYRSAKRRFAVSARGSAPMSPPASTDVPSGSVAPASGSSLPRTLPEAGILLANPRKELPTAAVFAARSGPFGDAGRFAPMPERRHRAGPGIGAAPQ